MYRGIGSKVHITAFHYSQYGFHASFPWKKKSYIYFYSDKRITSLGSNTAIILPIAAHPNVSLHSPRSSPWIFHQPIILAVFGAVAHRQNSMVKVRWRAFWKKSLQWVNKNDNVIKCLMWSIFKEIRHKKWWRDQGEWSRGYLNVPKGIKTSFKFFMSLKWRISNRLKSHIRPESNQKLNKKSHSYNP